MLGYFSKDLSFKLKKWYLKAFDTTFDSWARFICKTFEMFEIVAKNKCHGTVRSILWCDCIYIDFCPIL